jgi:hypothetical protein
MPRNYKVRSLLLENAALAFPLIQSAVPNVSLDAWLAYVAAQNQARMETTGIIIVQSKRGYIHGLLQYRVATTLGHGKALHVEHLIALDTGDRAAAIKMLIGIMDDLARKFDCAAIYTSLPDAWVHAKSGMPTVLDHLRDAGHERESVKLFKGVPVS